MRTQLLALALLGSLSWNTCAAQSGRMDARQTVRAGGCSADAMRERLDEAIELRHAGRYDEATELILSLWDCPLELMDDETHVIRGMAAIIAEGLVNQHAPSALAFFELRERLAEEIQGDEVYLYTLHDWVRLNDTIGDEARSMYFYDEAMKDPASEEMIEFVAGSLVNQAFVSRRWDVLADLIVDPALGATNMLEVVAPTLEQTARMIGRHPHDDPAWVAGLVQVQMIAALHAGDGGAAERRLIAALEGAMPGRNAWRIAFIHSARLCGKARPDHIAWVEEHGLDDAYLADPVILRLKSMSTRSR